MDRESQAVGRGLCHRGVVFMMGVWLCGLGVDASAQPAPVPPAETEQGVVSGMEEGAPTEEDTLGVGVPAEGPSQEALAELRAALEAEAGPLSEEEFQAAIIAIQENVALDESLNRQSGTINLSGGMATIELGDGLHYLSPADADRVIQAWGNPPMPESLGMLIPSDRSPFEMSAWAVVLTFTADGWVDDDDAEDLDYDELLEEMQSDTQEANATRRQLGLAEMTLVGWAEPPHYDGATHRLYWAKELRSQMPGATQSDLNYAIRILGRRGVLELNAVAPIEMLPTIRTQMNDVLNRVHFEVGHRYEDFDPDVDEVAAYGIGALILGKLAAKTGFFAMIALFFLKAKKLLIVLVLGLLALGRGVFRKLLGRSAPESDVSTFDDAVDDFGDGIDDGTDDEIDASSQPFVSAEPPLFADADAEAESESDQPSGSVDAPRSDEGSAGEDELGTAIDSDSDERS